MPFYPGEEGSLSYNTNISLDGSTPHIKEITFAGTSNDTYAGGDVVQVQTKRNKTKSQTLSGHEPACPPWPRPCWLQTKVLMLGTTDKVAFSFSQLTSMSLTVFAQSSSLAYTMCKQIRIRSRNPSHASTLVGHAADIRGSGTSWLMFSSSSRESPGSLRTTASMYMYTMNAPLLKFVPSIR